MILHICTDDTSAGLLKFAFIFANEFATLVCKLTSLHAWLGTIKAGNNTNKFLKNINNLTGYCAWEYTPTRRGFDSFLGFYLGSQNYFTHDRSEEIPVYVFVYNI